MEPRGGEGSTAITGMDKAIVRGELRKGIQKLDGFTTVTRTDIDQMMKEQNFQRTGMVSDEQIKKLGEMAGADYICVSTINKSQTQFYLEAYLIELETGEISNPATQYGEMVNGKFSDLLTICENLAQELCGITPSRHSNNRQNNSRRSATGQAYTETELGLDLKMVYVEGGSFLMGCTSEQSDCSSNEKNVRRVTLDGYYIGMFEITQKQWELVMGTSIYQQQTKAGLSQLYGVGPDYPMYYVSWEEAMTFCQELSRLTGKTYTLPTEAQWEYAARGGNRNDGTKYSGSHSADLVAWYDSNSGNSTHIVGAKRANGLGIYDMSGNVWEWCKDWYADSYQSYQTNNPEGPSSGSYRVTRGGGWLLSASVCRVAFRYNNTPTNRNGLLGFRVVLIP
ncbi:MAG: SUMF1/EgtB/PvdO family nonheme iron enzyme [Bacteroidales bacterium]|nr:SUMF1/EgtB/PvdO family nonheme iron enzyme [Bacteroidales bacterium]